MVGDFVWRGSLLGFGLFITITADSVDFNDNCGNCTVSNGLGFNSYQGDCSCYWTCVLKRSGKLMSSPANDWVSYKRCCPCDMVWSQKLLTCVDYRSKLSDCFRGDPSLNPCTGMAPGSYVPRTNEDNVQDTSLCAGYIRCVEILGTMMPRPECCPAGQCFDSGSVMTVPCSEAACTGECSAVEDCQCEHDELPERECPYQSVTNDVTLFMGRENMLVFSCAAGTCWSQEECTCVKTNNTAYGDCIPWAEMNFDDGNVRVISGRGNEMWSESTGVAVPCCGGGALGTDSYAQFYGNDASINMAALANSYIGNTFVIRYFFKLENNGGAPLDDELQTLVTNCHDDSGNGIEKPTFDVCAFRQGGTGNGMQVATRVQFNKGWFMLGDSSMDEAVVNLALTLSVDVWYEYWLMYCGEDELMYNAILQDGVVLDGRSYPIADSRFILTSQSGFVFGTSLESFKMDYNGGIDQVLLYRCKPFGDPDFDADFQAIKTFVNEER